MLVLTRKVGERILIEPGIEIAVVGLRGNKVQIGVQAPREVSVRRAEIPEREGHPSHAELPSVA